MIQCETFSERGFTRVSGEIPNGHIVVTRSAEGVLDTVLRNGDLEILNGGFLLEDSEAPVGVPITYRTVLEPYDRVIQENYVSTPNFMHGLQSWVAGQDRAASTVADAAASHPTVGQFSNNLVSAVVDPSPTLVGHLEATAYVNGNYTITPPTTGGSAIATNDWVYIVHHQLSAAGAPTIPSGFTAVPLSSATNGAVSVYIWRRKRQAGDTGYTVTVPSGGAGLGTALWFRGAGDVEPAISPFTTLAIGGGLGVQTPRVTAIQPAKVITVIAAKTFAAASLPGAGQVTGSTYQYTVGTSPNTRSTTILMEDLTEAGLSTSVTAVYGDQVTDLLMVQFAVLNVTPIAPRIIAKAKLASTLSVTDTASPYRMTGRFRYTNQDVWLWSDVKANGTWGDLLAAKATWEEVRSSATGDPGATFAKLFVVIANPATGNYYFTPVQVLGFTAGSANTWLDFVFYFNPRSVTVSTAEIWFIHGSSAREFNSIWYLDSIGLTRWSQMESRDTLYYFDGDTPVPENSASRIDPDGEWVAVNGDDSSIEWAGTPGNSMSVYTSPTAVASTTTCVIELPDDDPLTCGPVILSDPVSTALGIWVGLMEINDLSHDATQIISKVINRADPVVNSQTRSWETGEFTVMTNTLEQRDYFLQVARSGRILLWRNPDRDYPENNWYIACGDITESRISPDHRHPARMWMIPFVRVERPAGLIEISSGTTWGQVKTMGTWGDVLAQRSSWLELMTVGVD